MQKLLAANRGEIAIRIMRAATELGLRTVGIYSKEDRLSLHRFKADETYLIGEEKGPVEAYLDVEGIVALAAEKGVDAIHPGYGFLSENPALPRACEKAGITFVGPSAELLELLGDKTAARRLAEKAGVPVVPGTEQAVSRVGLARKAASKIGFPLIIKAAFGGGGRGMRVVESAADLESRFEEASREAAAAFGNGAVFLERFIRRPRHIDYGKIHTYRSPAGFGLRLDGASAYGGAVISPYYDSLLVKVTAWGREFRHACQRMDRGLREFRVRGVKTNIPFLENVVNHPVFQSGRATTRFIEETPGLFAFLERRDRATKLLTYLGEVIVNGNPEVKDKVAPAQFRRAPAPSHDPQRPAPGTRQLLEKLGPVKFAEWTRAQKRLLITDTTFRDAHQSLMATRVRTYDLAAISDFVAHRLSNLYSLEMWGGATFDVAMRFLLEDPWSRLRRLRELIPNICFQMLLRASNAVGYTAYPDNVVREFISETASQGIDIFRIFDSLNWLPNMKVAMEAVLKTGKICEAAICYTGDILDPKREKYPLNYYVQKAKELDRMGAHFIGVKDMAGVCKPYAAEKLVKTLRDEVGLPVHFHTHDTSGVNAASILKASDAGADIADAAVASMSGTTSQPNLNSVVAALAHTRRDTGLNLDALNLYSDYWEAVREYYRPFDNAPKAGTAEVYLHEMPGGQYTNLREQAESMGLGERWPEIAHTYADVNRAFGDIVKVTPSSKVVGDMALFLVSRGLTMQEFEARAEEQNLNVPNSVVEMLSGTLGQPDGGWPKKLQRIILRGAKTIRGRPGAHLKSVDFGETAELLEEKIARRPVHDEVLSYLMYPEVFTKLAKAQQSYGDVDVLPTPQFFYGMKTGEEITIEIEPGKTLIVKFLTLSEAHPDGTRTVFFELNGQPREVTVRDKSQASTEAPREFADPGQPGQVGAPTPGVITVVAVDLNQTVQKGDRLLVLEAMKMQSTVYAPISGMVAKRLVHPGQTVEAKELLLVIE